jgi:hypothetical protein
MTIEEFCASHLHPIPGALVPLKTVRELFLAQLRKRERYTWTKTGFSRALWELGFATGIGNANRTYIINVSLNPDTKPSTPLVLFGADRHIRRQL